MGRAKKSKVSVTISTDLLAEIDSYAESSGIGNRSNVIELWLRRVSREQAKSKLDEDTVAYYSQLTADEHAEDAEWADAASAEFPQLDID